MSWNNFKAPNIGLLVYKRLYSEQSIHDLIRVHDGKLEINISKDAKTTPFDSFYKHVYETKLASYSQIENPFGLQKFSLSTMYPGLLLGTGYTHDSNAKGDIKIGFFFDHTTGQPVIPGSTVKGVLKSVFENEEDVTDKTSVLNIRFFIEEILLECKDNEKSDWINFLNIITEENVELLKKLKEDIFGNQENEGKDVFFDAVIDFSKTDINTKFLSNDFITPHQPNLLKNPNPLMFLKVLPTIAFEFRFLLTESELKQSDHAINLKIKSNIKELLFKKIILTLGIGAKTNVGYGQFRELSEDEKNNLGYEKVNEGKIEKHTTIDKLKNPVAPVSPHIKLDIPEDCKKLLVKESRFKAKIIAQTDGYNYFAFEVNKKQCCLRKKTSNNPEMKIGDEVTVKFNQQYQSIENPQCKLI